jgi:hypothetical protein
MECPAVVARNSAFSNPGQTGLVGLKANVRSTYLAPLQMVLVHCPEAVILGLGGANQEERQQKEAMATHRTTIPMRGS